VHGRGSVYRREMVGMDRRAVRLLRRRRLCETTHPTRKDRRPPGRRRFAPEVWVGDGAPTLPIWNDGVAPNVQVARQRLSKRDGRDAAPSASDFCGEAAPVKQLIELEKIVVRPGDGASRLRFGSATARKPYHLGTTGSRGTCKWRGSAYRREMVGMPRRRRPTFAAWPPLSNNTSNSKRSSSARETALCA